METKEVLFNNIPFIVRENREEEDMNVLGEVFSEQNYPIEQFLDNAPKVVFDIGGHIGSFSKRCHNLFPDCYTYTVEPDKDNHELCKLNLENENNTIVRGVLNYYPEKVYFYRSIKEATGGGFLTNELIPTKDSVEQAEEQVYELHDDFDVKHYTLRTLMQEVDVDKIDLLKLDCEGGENGFLRDDCADLDILKNTNAIMGEWHGQEDYSEDLPTHSLLFNKLLDVLRNTHDCWMHDPKKNDGLGIFGFVKK